MDLPYCYAAFGTNLKGENHKGQGIIGSVEKGACSRPNEEAE